MFYLWGGLVSSSWISYLLMLANNSDLALISTEGEALNISLLLFIMFWFGSVWFGLGTIFSSTPTPWLCPRLSFVSIFRRALVVPEIKLGSVIYKTNATSASTLAPSLNNLFVADNFYWVNNEWNSAVEYMPCMYHTIDLHTYKTHTKFTYLFIYYFTKVKSFIILPILLIINFRFIERFQGQSRDSLFTIQFLKLSSSCCIGVWFS